MTLIRPLFRSVALVAFLGPISSVLVSCNPGPRISTSSPPPSGPPPKDLVTSDLTSLDSMDNTGLVWVDQKFAGRPITALFGEASGAAIHRFINARLHYYFTQEDLKQVTASNEGAARQMNKIDDTPGERARGLVTVARNIGADLWLLSLENGLNLDLQWGGTDIPVRSPRAGLIKLGDGYQYSLAYNGKLTVLPVGFRQAVLAHEARHSDCAEGFSGGQLARLRYTKGNGRVTKMCTYSHAICPEWMQYYHGTGACDEVPWGGYTVELLVDLAASRVAQGDDRAFLDIQVIDKQARLLFDVGDVGAMLNGDLGPPNLDDVYQNASNQRGVN